MNFKRELIRNRIGGLVGACLAVTVGLGLFELRVGQFLVHRSYDFLFAPRSNISADEARIIYLDEDSHAEMNQPLNLPWDRGIHAKLIEYLKTRHAKAVVFDIVFSDPGRDAEADASLAKAIKDSGRVVLAADAVRSGIDRKNVEMKTITMPYELFREANPTIGTAEIDPHDDLVVRRHTPISLDDQIPTLSWAAAELVGAPVIAKEKSHESERWINYYGPPLSLPSVSYYRIFSPEGVPSSFFSNKVVFVGAHVFTKFAGERKDEYPSPYSYWLSKNLFMQGVEIQTTMFLNLLRGDWLSRVPHEAWWLALLGIVLGFGLAQLRPLPAVGVGIVVAVVISFVSYQLFLKQRLLFSWLIVILGQIPVAVVWSVSFNSIRLYVQNRLYQQSIEMYLSPKLVKKFSSERDLLQPGARKQVITALFSDIAEFTSISEGMDSDELAHLMNSYFEDAVSRCIHATDGTVVKYIGDAIFAFWNAPEPQADHAIRACEAALLFSELPEKRANGRPLATRLGLHTGVANVGNFGSIARVDYTAVGESINLASRLEGMNKYLGTKILISADTQKEIAGRFLTRFVGPFRLKGFERTVDVYELVGRLADTAAHTKLHEAFEQALNLFRERDFALAQLGFHRALEINPNDGPTKFYLKSISEIRDRPLPENWRGETEFIHK